MPSPTLPPPAVSPTDALAVDRDGDIAILRLQRPNKRNAIDDATVLALESFFAAVPDGVKAVVLHGAGAHFCAGLDLSALGDLSTVAGVHHSRMWHRALDQLQFGTVPVVAVLHGATIGGGLELAAAAHLRVAEAGTYYALPEAQRGIFVGGGGSVRLPRLIGVARMTDMMLTQRTFSADEGQQIGLSNYLVEAGAGLAKGVELARRIAGNAPMTNYALMHALPRIAEVGRDQGLFIESLMAAIAQAEPEAKRRMREFLDKRASKVEQP